MRSVRSVLRLTRLAVTLATQPLANLEPGVGDVLAGREHRRPDGVDFGDRRIDQRQDDVDIVDHHIEDDTHVRAARRERRDAHRFDVERPGDVRCDGAEGVGEAFDQADLEHQSPRLGEGRDLLGRVHAFGERLLDQHVDAGVEEVHYHRVVRRGGHGDGDRIDLSHQRTVVGQGGGAERGRDGGGPCGVRVGDRDQAGAVERGHLLGVVAPEMACADHAESEWAEPERAGRPLPRLRCLRLACHRRYSTKSSASSKRSWVM